MEVALEKYSTAALSGNITAALALYEEALERATAAEAALKDYQLSAESLRCRLEYTIRTLCALIGKGY